MFPVPEHPFRHPDPLIEPPALELGERADDGQEQPSDAIAGDVIGTAVEIEQGQADAARLERLDDSEARGEAAPFATCRRTSPQRWAGRQLRRRARLAIPAIVPCLAVL